MLVGDAEGLALLPTCYGLSALSVTTSSTSAKTDSALSPEAPSVSRWTVQLLESH